MNFLGGEDWKVKSVIKTDEIFKGYLMTGPDGEESLMQPSMLTDNAPAQKAVAIYIQKQLSERLGENTAIQNQAPKTYRVDQQTQKFIYGLLAAGTAAAGSALIFKEVGKGLRKVIEENPQESIGLLIIVFGILYVLYGPKFPENNSETLAQNPDKRELEIEADLNLTLRAKVTENGEITSDVTVHNT